MVQIKTYINYSFDGWWKHCFSVVASVRTLTTCVCKHEFYSTHKTNVKFDEFVESNDRNKDESTMRDKHHF